MQQTYETRLPSLGLEDTPEKEIATQSSILAWRIPWTEVPGGLQSIGSQSWTQLKRLSIYISESRPLFLPITLWDNPSIIKGEIFTLKLYWVVIVTPEECSLRLMIIDWFFPWNTILISPCRHRSICGSPQNSSPSLFKIQKPLLKKAMSIVLS